jgi:hypothetical protein
MVSELVFFTSALLNETDPTGFVPKLTLGGVTRSTLVDASADTGWARRDARATRATAIDFFTLTPSIEPVPCLVPDGREPVPVPHSSPIFLHPLPSY